MKSLLDRFNEKWESVPESGCWIWIAACDSSGYGAIGVNYSMKGAHRVSYELFIRAIPDGMQLDHVCRVRCCVNPNHLESVTQLENVRRGNSGKFYADKTHCPQGHPYSGDNLCIEKGGGRRCKICKKETDRKQKAKNAPPINKEDRDMRDVMTNQEINIAIDRGKGFPQIANPKTGECGVHWEYSPDSIEPAYIGPDYIGDWKLLGPLILDLPAVEQRLERPKYDERYEWSLEKTTDDGVEGTYIIDKNFGRATGLAYIEEFGDE